MSRRARGPAPHQTDVPAEQAVVTDLEGAGSTPILEQYRAVKAAHPDALVMARLGDFYEMFGADAQDAAPILGVALTGRGFGGAGRLPMCGVPHHAAPAYVRRLLEAGRRVALWDQVGEVVTGRLVRREVVRVLSPGTAGDAEYLDDARVARCVAVHSSAGHTGIAALDVAGGELLLAEVAGGLGAPAVREECERLNAAELLVAEGAELPAQLLGEVLRTLLPAAYFDASRSLDRLLSVTGASAVDGLAVEGLERAVCAAGAVLAYCERAGVTLIPGFVQVRRRAAGAAMRLDAQTRRNLELVTPLAATGHSVAGVVDRTRTPMGVRLLRARLLEPLVEPLLVIPRQDAVAALVEAARVREALGEALAAVHDLERLVGRCVQGTARPRDLGAIRQACVALPAVAEILATVRVGELDAACAGCTAPDDLSARLRELLVDDPPVTARDGGCIRPGADAELDRLVDAGADARAWIAGLEERERRRTGIASLRVGYNRVFGYHLEVPNSQREAVPADYVRRQTLVGSERYVTAELKEREATVLGSRELSVAREVALLEELRALVAAHAASLLRAAAAAAVVDVDRSLACVAVEERWVRPLVDSSGVIDIDDGRHPLVERALGPGRFVANDCRLDAAERIMVLTGPNMAGKSTYLRQVALIVLLAQAGSFVPAARARIGVCDRVFTRIGAQDDLSGGLSTFMVEMAETAAILRQASPRSLVVLDEVGRGTSTYDGLSIAQAVIEHLHEAPHLNCRTLFATHYHELTALAGQLPRVGNARVDVLEEGDAVTFLHRIVPGGADRSYGIHVARLAGVPAGVLVRARELLSALERERPPAGVSPAPDQLSLGITTPPEHPVVVELAQLDIDGLTPIAALNKLAELRERAAT